MQFRIDSRDPGCGARAGLLSTAHGDVSTPFFMPVATRAAVRALDMRDVDEIGFQMILSNTYHLYIRPGCAVLEAAGGLHRFMNCTKPILTDSGGYQVFSLSDLCTVFDHGVEFRSHLDGSRHLFTPERVLEIQRVIGSDIMMVLDQCTEYPVPENVARDAADRTMRWAEESINVWRREYDMDRQALFAIVQGSTYPEIRRQCARQLVDLDFPGYAVGGLSVGEPKGLYREITDSTVELLPPDRPRYMMGVGSPLEILYAVERGIDMFDCVMPTRIARNGTLFTSQGRVNIRAAKYETDFGPLDPDCSCSVCSRFTRAYLRHIFRVGEVSALIYLTYHNLFFMKAFMSGIRDAICSGTFAGFSRYWESVYRAGENEN